MYPVPADLKFERTEVPYLGNKALGCLSSSISPDASCLFLSGDGMHNIHPKTEKKRKWRLGGKEVNGLDCFPQTQTGNYVCTCTSRRYQKRKL